MLYLVETSDGRFHETRDAKEFHALLSKYGPKVLHKVALDDEAAIEAGLADDPDDTTVAAQVSEDTCTKHKLFLCEKCFDFRAFDTRKK